MTASGPGTTVSLIVPCYNDERTLRPCLESVYAQIRLPDEVLVVDDQSTDRSRRILRDFPCRVVRTARNSGPAAARNRGVRETSGEIVFFLDADVALSPDAVGNAVRILAENPQYACAYGNYATTPMIGESVVERYRALHAHYWRARAVGRVPTVVFALCAIRRSVLNELGPLDESLRASEDVEYSNRMTPRHSILLTSDITGRHDDESELLPMLTKQFKRSQWIVPVAAAHPGPAGLRANRRRGLVAAALSVLTLPLAVIGLPLLGVPAAFFLLFVLADPGLLRLALREGGRRFVLAVAALHFLAQLAIVSGAVYGGVRWLIDPDFTSDADGQQYQAIDAPAEVRRR